MAPSDLNRSGCLSHMREDSGCQAVLLDDCHILFDYQLFWVVDRTVFVGCQVVHRHAVSRQSRRAVTWGIPLILEIPIIASFTKVLWNIQICITFDSVRSPSFTLTDCAVGSTSWTYYTLRHSYGLTVLRPFLNRVLVGRVAWHTLTISDDVLGGYWIFARLFIIKHSCTWVPFARHRLGFGQSSLRSILLLLLFASCSIGHITMTCCL